jgi:DNA-binding GntR family transcriptional regulator
MPQILSVQPPERPPRTVSHPIDRKLPAADQIYRVLRDAIISGGYRPREALSENRICSMFSVSRSPVRIALTRLVEDSLIDILPQRGSFVSPINLTQVREGHFARVALELALVREAASRWSSQRAAPLREAIKLQKKHARAGDAWSFHMADEQFHRGFASAAGLEGVWTTVQGLKTHLDRVRHLANPVRGHMERVIAEHADVMAALDEGRVEDAVSAMRSHLDSLHETIARLKPLHEDYFTDA